MFLALQIVWNYQYIYWTVKFDSILTILFIHYCNGITWLPCQQQASMSLPRYFILALSKCSTVSDTPDISNDVINVPQYARWTWTPRNTINRERNTMKLAHNWWLKTSINNINVLSNTCEIWMCKQHEQSGCTGSLVLFGFTTYLEKLDIASYSGKMTNLYRVT